MKQVKLGLVFMVLIIASGCGARVGNSFVIGTPSIHSLDNERLKIAGAQSSQGS